MNLVGPTGELRFTIEIKRKDTGKIDTFNLVGQVTDAQLKEIQDGSHTLDSSEERSD
tara:strand:+ start:253 stop:423 length:171 start_codon:yes stop_codon:yes gene_type:complete